MAVEVIDKGKNNSVQVHPWFDLNGRIRIEFFGDNNRVALPGRARQCGRTLIQLCNNSSVSIGHFVKLGDTFIFCRDNAHVSIGDETSFVVRARFNLQEPSRVTLGRDCMIASDVQFMTSDAHTIADIFVRERTNYAEDIVLGDHVWIALQCFVLKGANIGSGSAIGMRSVVSGSIPPNCLAAGAPIRVLRHNIVWDRTLVDKVPLCSDSPGSNSSMPTLSPPHKPPPAMPDVEDAFFWSLYRKCAPYSLLTLEKFYNLYAAAEYVCDREVQGDIIECGVWKGGAVLMVADVLARRKMLEYNIYLYDTFAGFVERSDSDVNYAGAEIGKVKHADFLAETRQNLALSEFPAGHIHFVQGDVRETVRPDAHEKIALLRLDTDTYASTLHELEALYDRVVTGGVVIIDDYGYSRGCRAAFDEFFSTRPKLLFQRPNSGARTAVKL